MFRAWSCTGWWRPCLWSVRERSHRAHSPRPAPPPAWPFYWSWCAAAENVGLGYKKRNLRNVETFSKILPRRCYKYSKKVRKDKIKILTYFRQSLPISDHPLPHAHIVAEADHSTRMFAQTGGVRADERILAVQLCHQRVPVVQADLEHLNVLHATDLQQKAQGLKL